MGLQNRKILTISKHTFCANNPIVYYDPDGDLFLPLIILISAMVSVLLMATAPDENNAEENASVSGSASPDPLTFGFDIFGVGYSFTMEQPGVTCDFVNGCQEFTQTGGQFGPLGINNATYEDGSNTKTISFLVFYISIDNNDFDDFSSWGAGLSFSISSGIPSYGSGTASFDVDFLGLIRDQYPQGE